MTHITPIVKVGDKVKVRNWYYNCNKICHHDSKQIESNKNYVWATVTWVHPDFGWCLCTYTSGIRAGVLFTDIVQVNSAA